MNNTNTSNYISKVLINWYNSNKRELPWRDINDPYRIWISEIILQQTRVNQGISYYLRFIERFPTVSILANSDEDEVLKNWQGLGYYSRARNIHKAANQVISNFGGLMPFNYKDVLTLAGIGDYTAAAICSFAYNQPYAVVDGNVFRVISRLFGIKTPIDTTIGKKQFADLAHELLSKDNPGLHNQAIIEFGALQCVPVSPDCSKCPLQNICFAFSSNMIAELPIKSKKIQINTRFFNYLNIEYLNNTYLKKRTAKDIWQNLYEYVLIESDHLLTETELLTNEKFQSIFKGVLTVEIINFSKPIKHILTHRVIHAQCITIRISNEIKNINNEFEKVDFQNVDKYAVSRLMELFLGMKK